MTDGDFERFVEDTKGIVLAAVRRYLPPDLLHAIDDVVQETYLRAYRGMGSAVFSGENSNHNWLYTIAKNESLRTVGKAARENESIKLLAEELASKTTLAPEHFGEEITLIRETISILPEKYRNVFELLIMGFSEEQIAQRLSIRRGTIKSRIHRGREMLSRILSERRSP